MKLYGRDPSGRYYEVRRDYRSGRPYEGRRGTPGKSVLKVLLVFAAIIVIASMIHL